MKWSPARYARFQGPRLQPGLDLLCRLPELDAKRVVDLGCGDGELTALLAERFEGAEVLGVDSSPQMLEKARARLPSARFEEADIADFQAPEPLDVLFSNAALHWLPDHAGLFPRLLRMLRPGGVLAVQMPDNFHAPSHTLVREALGDVLALPESRVLEAGAYFDLLRDAARVEVWRTEYLHLLTGDDPVLEWTRATTLLPVRAGLPDDQWEAFLDRYRQALREAYPRRADGSTLFPFRRLFLLAVAIDDP